ncbi:MAG: homoserine kinase [Clostridia bacterium]|nr:homoserine kinase [Clostridia bacterium]MDD4048323.1 homoserine kinase [Clostridia bacterium]
MLKVSVPATSANLGSGFDCIGVALNLYNDFYFFSDNEQGVPSEAVLLEKRSLAHQGMNLVAEVLKKDTPNLKIAVRASVPSSRGLGSSATLAVAGLVAANVLLKGKLDEEKIISLATEIEGHPDNAAPALVGGMVISVTSFNEIKYIKIRPQNNLRIIVAVPDFQLSTVAARNILPKQVSREDAVFNTGRFGMFMTSILTGDYRYLNIAMEDALHQPYRMSLIPGFKEVITAAYSKGALGSCLSGAGPTVLAFCKDNEENIRKSMVEAWSSFGISAVTHVLDISSKGTLYKFENYIS